MITASTQLYCLFGNPAGHSLSPVMHNAAFEANSVDAVYLAFDTEDINSAIHSLKTLNIKGASITIPHKISVMPHLDVIDDLAKKIGAVNTVIFSNGKLTGYNTDGTGASRALKNAGFYSIGSTVLIIGNGGSARAIAYTLLDEGASVIIAGRNMNNVQTLVNDLSIHYKNADSMDISGINRSFLSGIDAVINTTPVGMTPDNETSPLPGGIFSEKNFVFDIVYNPDETVMLQDAERAGCKTVKGLEMLLFQGARQFELWTGQDAPVDKMRKALVNVIRSRQ